MINKAMFLSKREFNEFTSALRTACEIFPSGTVPIVMRNGFTATVAYSAPATSDRALFHTPDWLLCWNLDGSSVTNKEFDIVEFRE